MDDFNGEHSPQAVWLAGVISDRDNFYEGTYNGLNERGWRLVGLILESAYRYGVYSTKINIQNHMFFIDDDWNPNPSPADWAKAREGGSE